MIAELRTRVDDLAKRERSGRCCGECCSVDGCGFFDDVQSLLPIAEAAYDYIATHGHWPHDTECAHSLAHEAGHYEGEFMKDRHWVYDSSVKCDCKLGALSRAVLGYENTQKAVP